MDDAHSELRVRTLLSKTLKGMILAYSGFTLGLINFLFFGEKVYISFCLLFCPAILFGVFCIWRDREIRKLGFSKEQPYPTDWSFDFHDREPEIFKIYTTLWTALLFYWAISKKFPN